MKIGIVTTWFERGAAYVSKLFKEQLEKDGHEVIIYARGGEEYAIGDPLWDLKEVTWGKKVNFPVESYVDGKCFCNWLDVNKPDVVLFNEQRWFSPLIYCRDRNIKIGAYIDFYTEEMLPTFKAYDFLICNTKKHYSAFSWHPQCFYIPWGTDVDLYIPPVQKENKQLVFFHSAGMNPFRKGTDLLLLAMNKLIELDDKKDIKLIIHTQIKSLSEFFIKSKQSHNSNDIIKAIKRLMQDGYLEIINKTVSAPGLYDLGDVYVYPSRLDGLGLTVPEALSCGLPTIIPNDGPMNEFVNDSCGYLCEIDKLYARTDGYYWPQNETSIISLTEALDFYRRMSKVELQEQKQNARNHALENLNSNCNFSKLSKVIKNANIIDLAFDDLNYINDFYPKKYKILDKFSFFYGFYKR